MKSNDRERETEELTLENRGQKDLIGAMHWIDKALLLKPFDHEAHTQAAIVMTLMPLSFSEALKHLMVRSISLSLSVSILI